MPSKIKAYFLPKGTNWIRLDIYPALLINLYLLPLALEAAGSEKISSTEYSHGEGV